MNEKAKNTTIPKTENINRSAGYFIKRIGHTEYRVGVHFSDTNKETAQDKITRLIRNDPEAGKAANL